MHKFWQMTSQVSAEILLWQADTLDIPGFRWAPRTFLIPHEDRINLDAPNAMSLKMRRTPNGLVAKLSGMAIDTEGASFFCPFYLYHEVDDLWLLIHMYDSSTLHDLRSRFTSSASKGPETAKWPIQSTFECLGFAVVFLEDEGTPLPSASNDHQFGMAVLVGIVEAEAEGQIKTCRVAPAG